MEKGRTYNHPDITPYHLSDKRIRKDYTLPVNIFVGPTPPNIGDIFPILSVLRDKLADSVFERTALFNDATWLSLNGFTLPDFYQEQIKLHQAEYSEFLTEYFLTTEIRNNF